MPRSIKPSFKQGISLFPLSPKGLFLSVPALIFSLTHTHKKAASLSYVSNVLRPYHAMLQQENLSGQPQGHDYHLNIEGLLCKQNISIAQGGRKKRKRKTNNTVQGIPISPVASGRKRLVESNLAEHLGKWSPDSMLLMPLLSAPLKRA